MRNVIVLIFLLTPGICGCDAPVSRLNVADASSITIKCYYENQELTPQSSICASKSQRLRIVQALRDLRWSTPGFPLSEISMIHPDIDIVLSDSHGITHLYRLYWTSNDLVDEDSGRLLTVDNIQKLRAEVTIATNLTSAPVSNLSNPANP